MLTFLHIFGGIFVKDSISGKGADRSVRVEDVAREAGVSPITVSRALRTPDLVRPETRQRVAEAVAKTGYVVNSIASTLRSGRSSIVTVFVASLQNPHFANAMQGALDAFEGSRFRLMFAQTGYSDQLEPGVVETLLPFRPAGLMFTGIVRREETRAALRAFGVPVIEMWGGDAEPIDMLVGSSGFAGGRLMARHFAERGFRRIAFAGYAREKDSQRLQGFTAGLAESGLKPELVIPRDGRQSFGDGMSAFDEIVARMPDCEAICFGTDVLAVGALLAARRHGIDIPRQIAVAGYGDLDFSAEVFPSLTTVRISDYEVGKLAGEMMLRRLGGDSSVQRIIQVPVELKVRKSTART
jgi:LacI family gluconate utilization system Gnt-I transcriptional repressor